MLPRGLHSEEGDDVKELTPDQIWMDLQGIADRLEIAPLVEELETVQEAFHDGVRDNFVFAQDAMGNGWPSRKDEGDGHPLLQENGDLLVAATGGPRSIVEIVGRELSIGLDASGKGISTAGAAVHNFGYPERNIPQREYLYASEETADNMVEVFADAATERIFA